MLFVSEPCVIYLPSSLNAADDVDHLNILNE